MTDHIASANGELALEEGDTIAGYEIIAPITAGGMATLHLARRTGAGGFMQHFALKVAHPHLTEDPQFVKMFLDEARLSARIDHPNCVHVSELGEANGRYFIAMEYVAGFSLSSVLKRLSKSKRRLTPEAAVHVAMQVAAGLHAAHELEDDDGTKLDVVHRDVSPQNVLLSDKGYVKLIDFGIAKARRRRAKTTQSGALKGKLAYMSPEQANVGAIDRRTDVYALGIVLWEMLTMRRRFWAPDPMKVLASVQEPRALSARAVTSDVDEALDAVVMKAMAARPEERFQTAREFRRALGKAVPDALTMDAPELASLVEGLMEREARKRTLTLPMELAAPSEMTPDQVQTAVARLTRKTIDHEEDLGATRPIGASGGRSAPQAGLDWDLDAPPAPAGRATLDALADPPRGSLPASEVDASPSRSFAMQVVGIGLAATVVGAGFVLWLTGSDTPPPSAAPAQVTPAAPVAESVPDEPDAAEQPIPAERLVVPEIVPEVVPAAEPSAPPPHAVEPTTRRRRRAPPEEGQAEAPPPAEPPEQPLITDNPFR